MSEAEELRNEALRLLRSVDSRPQAEAMGIEHEAQRLTELADRMDAARQVPPPLKRQTLKPKF
jgi:hypothetical protein